MSNNARYKRFNADICAHNTIWRTYLYANNVWFAQGPVMTHDRTWRSCGGLTTCGDSCLSPCTSLSASCRRVCMYVCMYVCICGSVCVCNGMNVLVTMHSSACLWVRGRCVLECACGVQTSACTICMCPDTYIYAYMCAVRRM